MTTTPHAELLTDAEIEAGYHSHSWGEVPHPFRGSVGFERGARRAERALLARLGEQPVGELAVGWIAGRAETYAKVYPNATPAEAYQAGAEFALRSKLLQSAAHPPAARPAIDAEALHAAIRALGTLTQRQAADVVRVVMEMTGGAQVPPDMTAAVRDVLAERHRQVEVKGFDARHDDENQHEEMAFAAACYVTADEGQAPPADWPWGLKWWKPKGRRTNLVKAAALTIAEIERLDRAGAEQQAQLACLGPEWTVPAPDPVLADASFCIAVSGEGAIAHVLHGGWLQLLTAFAAELWTDGNPKNGPEEWAEWLKHLQDMEEWSTDEMRQPFSFTSELGETAHVSIYRLARGAA